MIEQAQEGERKRDGTGEAREKKPELRERESRRRKEKENAPCLGNTFPLVSRAFVNTPWDASAPGD